MLLCAQYILPITSEPFQDGAVLVRDGVIRDIGKVDMLKLRYPEEEVADFGLAALMPGLVDLHTHLENSVMRGIVHDVPYTTWILSVAEKSSKVDVSDWYDSAILGGLDALSSGITCVADITVTGAACTATQKLGLRSVIYREVGAMDKRRVDYAMRMAENDIMHWREEVDSSRITIGVAPGGHLHVPSFGLRPRGGIRQPREHACGHAPGRQPRGKPIRPVRFVSVLGARHGRQARLRGDPPVASHGHLAGALCAQLGRVRDIERPGHPLRARGRRGREEAQGIRRGRRRVPRCNAQLGMGVAPVNEFLRAGLRLGLGTDSPAATDSTDMLTEMRLGMLVQRAVDVNEFLDSSTMLEMATMGGARALRLDDKIGSLDVGKRADVIAVDLSSSHQTPTTDPVSAVVNTCTATDVLMTMVDGKLLYEKSRWHVDVEVAKNIARVIEIRGKLRL